MTVLLLTADKNVHANKIEEHLQKKRVKVVRLNFDKVSVRPEYLSFTGGADREFTAVLDGHILDPCVVSGVFSHHPRPVIPENFGVDAIDRELWKSSWKSTISWFEWTLRKATWVNSPSMGYKSSSNALQFLLAQKCGLTTPLACLTNDIEELKRTFVGRKVVLKTGNLPGFYIAEKRILTHMVDIDKLADDDLRFSPCLFQEYIEKEHELRVYVVKGQVFACKIESQQNKKTQIDWRNYNLAHTPHFAVSLDRELEDKCIKIIAELGLSFGAIDLIVDPSGEVVFLECNSQGHWLWIEKLTGLPITRAICDLLVVK